MHQKTKGNVVLLFPYFPSTSVTTPFLLTCLKPLFSPAIKLSMSADLENLSRLRDGAAIKEMTTGVKPQVAYSKNKCSGK